MHNTNDWLIGLTEAYDTIFCSLLNAHIPWKDSKSTVSSCLWHSKIAASITSPQGEIFTPCQKSLQRSQLWGKSPHLNINHRRLKKHLVKRFSQQGPLHHIAELSAAAVGFSHWPTGDSDYTAAYYCVKLSISCFSGLQKTSVVFSFNASLKFLKVLFGIFLSYERGS